MADTFQPDASLLPLLPPEERAKYEAARPCAQCGEPSITHLDGDSLCQTHADEWVRGEGVAAAEADRDEAARIASGGDPWEHF